MPAQLSACCQTTATKPQPGGSCQCLPRWALGSLALSWQVLGGACHWPGSERGGGWECVAGRRRHPVKSPAGSPQGRADWGYELADALSVGGGAWYFKWNYYYYEAKVMKDRMKRPIKQKV